MILQFLIDVLYLLVLVLNQSKLTSMKVLRLICCELRIFFSYLALVMMSWGVWNIVTLRLMLRMSFNNAPVGLFIVSI